MDLSSPRFDRAAELVAWPGDLAVLMIGVGVRQGTSRTALLQSGFRAAGADPRLFAPLDGAFNGRVAAAITRWKDE